MQQSNTIMMYSRKGNRKLRFLIWTGVVKLDIAVWRNF